MVSLVFLVSSAVPEAVSILMFGNAACLAAAVDHLPWDVIEVESPRELELQISG